MCRLLCGVVCVVSMLCPCMSDVSFRRRRWSVQDSDFGVDPVRDLLLAVGSHLHPHFVCDVCASVAHPQCLIEFVTAAAATGVRRLWLTVHTLLMQAGADTSELSADKDADTSEQKEALETS